jgi:hypothetical protein
VVDKYIKDTLEAEYIISIPIELLTKEQLEELGEKAKKNNILATISAEHSNVHQGVLISLIRKDIAGDFLKWL